MCFHAFLQDGGPFIEFLTGISMGLNSADGIFGALRQKPFSARLRKKLLPILFLSVC